MTPAQLKERKLGVGGSDCASLFNVGYGCTRRLWYDKVDWPEDFPKEETKAMALGKVLEPFFADQYEGETGRTHLPSAHNTFSDDLIPQMRVNVDRVVFRSGPAPIPGVLEIKSVSRGVFYEIKRKGLPEDYILQVQDGLAVTGLTWGSFAIGNRDSGDLLWWDVERDEGICQRIKERVVEFWGLVENGRINGGNDEYGYAPPRLEPDDQRCQNCQWRTTCQGNSLITLGRQSEYEEDESLAGSCWNASNGLPSRRRPRACWTRRTKNLNPGSETAPW